MKNTESEKSSSNFYYADYIPGTAARLVLYPTQYRSEDKNLLSRIVCKFNRLNLNNVDPRVSLALFDQLFKQYKL